MIVVSNTTPISSLLKIDRIKILHLLFSSVIIPPAVQSELMKGFGNDPALSVFLYRSWVRVIARGKSLQCQNF